MNMKEISTAIEQCRPVIAQAVAGRQYAEHPELKELYGPLGWQRTLEDANHNISFLAQAIALDNSVLFADYLGWLKVVLLRRGVRLQDLLNHLDYLQGSLRDQLSPEAAAVACTFISYAIGRLPEMPEDLPSLLEGKSPLVLLARQYLQTLLCGERKTASRMILAAVERGVTVKDIYLGVFQPCQREIGRLWQTNQISVAEEHFCTAVTQLIMSQLAPQIFAGEKTAGRMVATCVSSELHEIGVRMVADFFEMHNWGTWYLGANTPTESVLRLIVERKPQVLAISATITYHIDKVEQLIRAVRADANCRNMLILAGGYPFNLQPDLWRGIGADGSAPNASEAVLSAQRLMEARRG
jgi:MerR family transcriptional regulator, light-induced transcriptional regulator